MEKRKAIQIDRKNRVRLTILFSTLVALGMRHCDGKNTVEDAVKHYAMDTFDYITVSETDKKVWIGINNPDGYEVVKLEAFTEWLMPKHKVYEVRLNSSYLAEVNKDCVRVGCSTFTHEVIFELTDMIKLVKQEV